MKVLQAQEWPVLPSACAEVVLRARPRLCWALYFQAMKGVGMPNFINSLHPATALKAFSMKIRAQSYQKNTARVNRN